MKNFRLIKSNIDVKPFLVELAKNEDYWSQIRSQVVKVQRETLNIPLRRGIKEEDKIIEDCHNTEKTELYILFPILTAWVESFAKELGELARLMIVSLQPEGKVYPHTDFGEYYKARDRYHLVLQSKSGSEMFSGDEKQTFKEGELWWINNKIKHEVSNPSKYPRIHIIFDVLPRNGRPKAQPA